MSGLGAVIAACSNIAKFIRPKNCVKGLLSTNSAPFHTHSNQFVFSAEIGNVSSLGAVLVGWSNVAMFIFFKVKTQ